MMSTGKHPHDEREFDADPEDLDADLDAVRPGWPKGVGIPSIILGALMLVCNGMGVAWFSVGQPWMMQQAIDSGQMEGGVPPFMMQPMLGMTVLCVVGLLVSVLLVVAGISTVARRPAGRALHLAYGALSVVTFGVSMYMNMSMQAQTNEWIQQNPDSGFAAQAQQSLGPGFGLAMGVLLGLVWPVFCLIWFGLVKKRPEDMTGGVAAPAA